MSWERLSLSTSQTSPASFLSTAHTPRSLFTFQVTERNTYQELLETLKQRAVVLLLDLLPGSCNEQAQLLDHIPDR